MRTIYLLLLATFFSNPIYNQCFIPLPLDEINQESDYIVEGKVIDTRSIDGINSKMIYTGYTIDIYKVIKGNLLNEQIEIIRPGGQIDERMVVVTATINLSIGETGTFFLKSFDNSQLQVEGNALPTFKGSASQQAVFSYDPMDHSVSNPFLKFNNYQEDWYARLGELLNKEISGEIPLRPINYARSAASITGFSPSSISAGTYDVLTINGSGFGNTRGTSVVRFFNADNGGASLISAPSTHYVSWSDSQIEVIVPTTANLGAYAGTGPVRIELENGMQAQSAATLEIIYATFNFEFLNVGGQDWIIQTEHQNDNGAGGYNFQYNVDFVANNPAVLAFERAFNNWRCETDVNWIIGNTTTLNTIEQDDINLVTFGTSIPVGVIGQATSYFNTCWSPSFTSMHVIEIDIIFNSELPITVNGQLTYEYGPALPSVNEIDFETVALHELGHAHQLGHVIEDNKLMYYGLAGGLHNRNIDADAAAGALTVHSRSVGNPTYCGFTPMTDFNNFAFVDPSASGLGNGDTWENAFSSLQNALTQKPCVETILLAEGTYYPDEGIGITNNDPTASFVINEATTILGGFAPGGATRNISVHKSILSGDINKNMIPEIGPDANTVMTIYADAILDGIEIANGAGSGPNDLTGRGGGVFQDGNAQYINTTFKSNLCFGCEGGGIYQKSGTAIHTNTIFDSNQAFGFITNGPGGGLFINGGSAILNGCSFIGDNVSLNDLYCKNGAVVTIQNSLSIDE